MTLVPLSRRAAGAALGVAALAGLGVVGVTHTASAASPAPTAAPSAAASGHQRHAGKARPLRRLEHGSLTLRAGKATKVVDLQRGTVTAVSPTSVTVLSKDGFTGTYAVAETTKVRRSGAAATIADVHVGDRVATRATGGTALQLRDGGAAPAGH